MRILIVHRSMDARLLHGCHTHVILTDSGGEPASLLDVMVKASFCEELGLLASVLLPSIL